jgi:hypothetical protein
MPEPALVGPGPSESELPSSPAVGLALGLTLGLGLGTEGELVGVGLFGATIGGGEIEVSLGF